jgi:hypothetical protein
MTYLNVKTASVTLHEEALRKFVQSLDISEAQHERAVKLYGEIGLWLSACPILGRLNPTIFSQGSFRLGTIIKPLSELEEYDIDLVCELLLATSRLSQMEIKELVGNRLRQHPKYSTMLDKEGQCCWTLIMPSFHMDILPTRPDRYRQSDNKIEPEYLKNPLNMTNKSHPNYNVRNTEDCPKTNPDGYFLWFKTQMSIDYNRIAGLKASELKLDIKNVPEYKVKTPLQRAIQIMKRHRDVMFEGDSDRPISIIITTLAAHAYEEEGTIYDALMMLLYNMSKHIKYINGLTYIPNPVAPSENFADKWNKYPIKRIKFFNWIEKAKKDFESLKGMESELEVNRCLSRILKRQTLKSAGFPFTTNTVRVTYNSDDEQIALVTKSKNGFQPWLNE